MNIITLESNRCIMQLFDPNTDDALHFSSRYSHCGYIKQIYSKLSGVNLLGMPIDELKPFFGEGFPEEFEMPLCYDAAKAGEGFLKIGVGIEQRLSDKPYTNWDMHPIIKKACTKAKMTDSNAAVFTQTAALNHNCGYGYTKTVTLTESGFSIAHALTNTGRAAWHTLWYSHCFLALDESGKGVSLGISPNCKLRKSPVHLRESDGKYIIDSAAEGDGECINWDVDPKLPNVHAVHNTRLKYAFIAEGDYPYHELQVYVNNRIISPEPKVIIKLQPDESFHWSTAYTLM